MLAGKAVGDSLISPFINFLGLKATQSLYEIYCYVYSISLTGFFKKGQDVGVLFKHGPLKVVSTDMKLKNQTWLFVSLGLLVN